MGRLVRASMVSIDGFYEDADGTIEWGMPEPELHSFANEKVGDLAAIVMGRRLYEVMVPYWHETLESGEGDEIGLEFARLWDRLPKYVASRTLTEVHESCRLIEGDAIEAILDLKRETEGDIEVGGGILSAQLDALGEIDVYNVWTLPVRIGGGKHYFPAGRSVETFELTDLRRFPEGGVALEYTLRR
ncbi:MAG: dihydrofolate reductase family protein [Solirubrobacterales bacterium]|nr:dihydrofolate reductase family protein [Solirubrobacterales bacterium]